MPIKPGDRVSHNGEHRIVVDVTEDGWAVLRYPDEDPRREVDKHGGDIHLVAAETITLRVVD